MRAALHHQGKAMQTTNSCSLALTSHPHHLALSHASGSLKHSKSYWYNIHPRSKLGERSATPGT